MGHFGRRPIAWRGSSSCCPRCSSTTSARARCCCRSPRPSSRRCSAWRRTGALYPMVILATMATVIASQALISGVFSLTMQAIQLGYAPRHRIRHMSDSSFGQVYLPVINWALMVGLHRARGRLRVVERPGRRPTAWRSPRRWSSPRSSSTSCFASGRAGPKVAGHVAVRRVPRARRRVLRRQPVQDPVGRLVPAHRRRRHVHADDDVAHRSPTRRGPHPSRTTSRWPTTSAILREPGTPPPAGRGHRGVPVLVAGSGPAGAHRQRQAQPLPAQSDRRAVDHDRHSSHASCRPDRADVTELGDGIYQVMLRYGFMEEPDVHGRGPRGGRAGVSTSIRPEATFVLGAETIRVTKRRAWRSGGSTCSPS